MNEKILQILNEHPDRFISGEFISKKLKCSRTAIWKHIQELRDYGYEFDAAPRRGYRLKRKPSRLDIPSIINKLQTKFMGRSLHYYDKVDSTQSIAHSLVAGGAKEGAVVIAEQQTAGRGRMGRNWFSPAGKGVWLSIVLTPQIPLQLSPQLTLLVSVALCRTITNLLPVDIGIKWPNDLLIKGKKVSGILLESSTEDERLRYVIAGIGISVNLTREDYPAELQDIATSLLIESGSEVNREELIAAFLQEFEDLYAIIHQQGFAPIRLLWEALSISLHRPIKVHTSRGRVEGIAQSIDDSGALIIKLKDGQEVKIYSGDVEVHR
ncbi:MAG TPA: biotin--[acetyl-CoA-carboxylase] ligase [Bacilli bacterium]